METLKVIKIGGNIIDNPEALEHFLHEFSQLEGLKILVHGGGKLATHWAQKLGIPVKMTDGRRITDAATLELITMVYAGKINKGIVAQLQAYGCNSMGFTGADGNTLLSSKRSATPIDFGYVGDVEQVHTETLQILLDQGITPVFCALTHDGKGQLLNTNADTIAAQLSIAFAPIYAVELYYCFEKNGVLHDVNDDQSVIPNITSATFPGYVTQGIITQGMLPKMTNSLEAVAQHVTRVCIGKPQMLFKKNQLFTTITHD